MTLIKNRPVAEKEVICQMIQIYTRYHHRTRFLWMVLFSLFAASCSSYRNVDVSQQLPLKQPLLIRNASVLSAGGTQMLEGYDLLVDNSKIVTVAPTPIAHDGVLVIDGTGKFVIPGLIDSHVHLQKSPNDLLAYLAYGVTYIREMSGNSSHIAWRQQIENGRAGPSIYVASEKIGSKTGIERIKQSLFYNRLNISTVSEAQSLVDELTAKGFDSAKISSDINKAMYLAITAAAKEKNMSVVGHIPAAITFDDFFESGQQEVAHIEEVVKKLNQEFGYYTEASSDEFLDFVKQRADVLAKSFKRHDISLNTSLWYIESIPRQISELSKLTSTLDLTFTNPALVEQWLAGENPFEQNHQHLILWWQTFLEANHLVLNAMLNNNVTILAGTDAMTTMVVPGASLHDELMSLVDAGMTPTAALLSATQAPATKMHKKVGRIASGFDADLVMLDNNPLHQIEATKQIHAVIKDGRFYDKAQLTNLLNQIRTAYGNQAK